MKSDEAKNDKRTPTAADYLGGESPHARGEKKRRRVLGWVHRWGYSSAEIIRQVAGQQAKGYATGLVKKGWLVETKTESGLPRYTYTLSETGQQEAERLADELHRYPEADPYRVNQQQIRHYLLAQQATVNALAAATITDYKTERMFLDDEGDQSGEKRPDVVWLIAGGQQIGVEIELSARWDRRLDEFVFKIWRALESFGPNEPERFARFVIVTDSPAIARRYAAAMQPGARMKTWKKNKRAHWEVAKLEKVPAWLIDKVDFVLLEE